MIRSALQYLMGLSAARLDNIKETLVPLAIVPETAKIDSLEKYMPLRSRFRGEFNAGSIDDLAEYVLGNSTGTDYSNTTCFIDVATMSAETILNIGTVEEPGHCDHTAKLKLQQTASYSSLISIINTPHSQKTIAEWLEDWRQCISVTDGNSEPIEIKRAIAAIRNITIEAKASTESSVGSFSTSKSSMEQIEAKARDAEPAFIEFTCIPFHGLKERTFTARLSITTEGQPKLILRIIRHEEAIEDMGNELKEIIDSKLTNGTTTHLGKFKSNA